MGTVLLFLVSAAYVMVDNAKADGAGWNSGEGWGYKWILDFSQKKADIEKQMESSAKNVSLHLGGRFSMMVYVRYVGKEGDSYRFDFKGGKYMSLNMSFEGEPLRTPGPINLTGNWRIEFSSYFSGYFLVVNESSGYYGISVIKSDIISDIYFSIQEKGTYANGTVRRYSELESGNVRYTGLNLTFSPSVPFLPGSTGNDSTEDVSSTLNYSAERAGHLSYYLNSSAGSDSIDQNLNGFISGKTRIQTSARYNTNHTMSFPMPAVQMSEISLLEKNGKSFDDIEADRLLYPLNERYENGFVSSITVSVDDFPLQVTSWPATEEEVNSYLQGRWGHAAGEWDPEAYAVVLLGILVAAGISAAVVISVRKRKNGGKERAVEESEQKKDAGSGEESEDH